MTPVEQHNAVVGPMLQVIVKASGCDPKKMLVLAETVVVGVFLLIVKLGGDEPVMDVFAEGVRTRLAQARLHDMPPAGEA
jgi:hypothetical protein